MPGFISALQLADASFPSGRYTLSHGLESLVQHGVITRSTDIGTLGGFLADQLRHGFAPSDGIALAYAHRAAADGHEALAIEADRRLTAVKLTREARDASTRTGRQLLATASGVFGGAATARHRAAVAATTAPGNAAVVMGLLLAELGVPLIHAAATELYAFMAGWLNAAVRLDIADHRVAQAILHGSRSLLRETSQRVVDAELDELSSCVPLIDVMNMRHEQASLRLFST
ncbi:hypothetical protein A5740_02355 [Mycobacterium sp. GA-1841]|nr:hypothetical protein A5740_02355 [Mycobacterium sp. GA-1841]